MRLVIVVLAGVLRAAMGAAQDSARPNIIVVLVDDLRWNAVGATGHPFIDTPNIDSLAREGVVFRNAFVTTPLCSPARASFLSGRHARSHGVLTNDPIHFLDGVTTFPELLHNAGYQTAFVGKWHVGGHERPRPGFGHWVGFAGQGNYWNEELNVDGRPVRSQGYLTDVLNAHAVAFVRDAVRRPAPFLLYLSHKAVHGPFQPPPRHAGLYAGAPVPCSPACRDTLEGKLALTRFVPGTTPPVPGFPDLTDEAVRNQVRLLASVDDGLGEILRVLEEARVEERTLVVFTSDNGYFHREHGLADKRWPYEEAIRIPFIARYPRGARSGVTEDALVLNIDLAPTLLELAGLTPPTAFEGKSLRPLLTGEKFSSWRTSFLTEYFEELPFPRIPTWEAIRTQSLKFIRYPGLGRTYDELYDLTKDPYELVNEITNVLYSDQAALLEAALDRLLESLAGSDDSGLPTNPTAR